MGGCGEVLCVVLEGYLDGMEGGRFCGDRVQSESRTRSPAALTGLDEVPRSKQGWESPDAPQPHPRPSHRHVATPHDHQTGRPDSPAPSDPVNECAAAKGKRQLKHDLASGTKRLGDGKIAKEAINCDTVQYSSSGAHFCQYRSRLFSHGLREKG